VAKRKSTSSAKPKTASASNRRPSANRNGASPTASKSRSKTPRPVSSPEIGRVAGEIWTLLSNNGEQTLAAIKKSVDASSDVVLAGIGWLAREDKLDFATSGRTLKISLR
jgi:hypothetical protein